MPPYGQCVCMHNIHHIQFEDTKIKVVIIYCVGNISLK